MFVKLSTQGRLTIPKAIREELGWPPGTEIESEIHGEKVVLRRASARPRITVEGLVGCTGYSGPPKSLEEMDAGVAEGARRWGENLDSY